MAYVYILESLKTNRFYIGSTIDLEKRLSKHNTGEVKSTQKFRPYRIVFNCEVGSLSQARKIELKLKRLKRKDYIKRIVDSGLLTFKTH